MQVQSVCREKTQSYWIIRRENSSKQNAEAVPVSDFGWGTSYHFFDLLSLNMSEKYRIFFDIINLQNRFNRIFDAIMETRKERVALGDLNPPVDICEREDCLVIIFEVPGFRKEDISLKVQRGTLYLKGKKEHSHKAECERYVCMERNFGSCDRRINLNCSVNPKQAEAQLSNGILKVKFPKIKDKRGEEINIEIKEKK